MDYYLNMKVKFKVINKCLNGYGVSNLTTNTHRSTYGIFGMIKNQTYEGQGVVKDDMLYVTWDIGGCTMLMQEKAIARKT